MNSLHLGPTLKKIMQLHQKINEEIYKKSNSGRSFMLECGGYK